MRRPSAGGRAPEGLDDGGSGAVEDHPGQAMDAQYLDQRPHLRLGPAQQRRPPARAQTASEQCEIDHERHIGGTETGEIDGDVRLGA